MSRGTPVRTLRVPVDLIERINAAMDSANKRRFEEPYDWSSWILKAATEKLQHLQRSHNRKKRSKRKGTAAFFPNGNDLEIVGEAHRPPSVV